MSEPGWEGASQYCDSNHVEELVPSWESILPLMLDIIEAPEREYEPPDDGSEDNEEYKYYYESHVRQRKSKASIREVVMKLARLADQHNLEVNQ